MKCGDKGRADPGYFGEAHWNRAQRTCSDTQSLGAGAIESKLFGLCKKLCCLDSSCHPMPVALKYASRDTTLSWTENVQNSLENCLKWT